MVRIITIKYKNIPCVYNGYRYQSIFEADVAKKLDILLKAGEIVEYKRQVNFPLQVNGYHITNYKIDFVVLWKSGELEYMEVKGCETKDWKIKWRLFQALKKGGNNKFTVIKKSSKGGLK